MSHSLFGRGALVALAVFVSAPAAAASDADLEQIRAQLRELKSQYESRIQALEARLKDAESKLAAPPAPTVAAAPPSAPEPAALAEAQAPAATGSNLAAALPTRAQFRDPRTRQPAAQDPPLFGFCLCVCDP